MDNREIIRTARKIKFPKTLAIDKWEKYIGRKLKTDEKSFLHDYKLELKMNACIKILHKRAQEKQLYIPYLTQLDGNCMFESLQYYNFFNNIEDFRKNIATMFLLYRDKKYLFKNQENTLEELFYFTNEIESVMDPKTYKIYKYTYDMMCIDLWNNKNWSRLPTQLIMMIISYFYDIKFIIINDDNDYETIIYCGNDENICLNIYLGHITESHYVPLAECKNENKKYVAKYHDEAKLELYKWIIKMDNKNK